jgi:hypothetical protein
MTNLLRKAFTKASKLPQLEQNAFARWMLEEMESENRWDQAFAKSEEVLGALAEEALREHARHRTKPLDPRRL